VATSDSCLSVRAIEVARRGEDRENEGMTKKPIGRDNLQSIPYVGPAIAAKLRLLGYSSPSDLAGQDPYTMYHSLCELTGRRHDHCLLDVFIAAVSFCNGNPPRPWWEFTSERKAKLRSWDEAAAG
jgi:hypothetical protein